MNFSVAFLLLAVIAWVDLAPSLAAVTKDGDESQKADSGMMAGSPSPPQDEGPSEQRTTAEASDEGASSGAGGLPAAQNLDKGGPYKLSMESAVDFCYKYAKETLTKVKRERDEEKYPRVLDDQVFSIARNFNDHPLLIELEARISGKQPVSSGLVATSAWKLQRGEVKSMTVTGKEREDNLTVTVLLTFVEGPSSFVDPYPIIYEQKPLPEHLLSTDAQNLADYTAKDLAKKLKKLEPTPGFLYVAVKKWGEDLANFHSESHFALELQAGDTSHFPIVKVNAITSKWGGHSERSHTIYKEAFIRERPYQVKVRVYYIDQE